MNRVVIALLGLCISATACGRAGSTSGSGGSLTPARSSGVDRTVGIYSPVIRQLVTKDASGGGDSEFRRVFVLDGVVDRAEDPEQLVACQKPKGPFDRTVKEGLTRALSDLAPITFIPDRSSVVTGKLPGHLTC